MADTIRLEEYTGVIQSKLIAVWQSPDAANPWLPTEFLLGQYITRILVVGRLSPLSSTLAADPSWTQIWRSPGAKEWACLLGILQHMPGPVLLVIGPDIGLSAKLTSSLKEATQPTTIVLRSPAIQGGGWVGSDPDHIFFPVLGDRPSASLMQIIMEIASRAMPKGLDLKVVLPQLNAVQYGLTLAAGLWHWYKPSDSPPLVTLSVAQIARQLQILSVTLEKMSV